MIVTKQQIEDIYRANRLRHYDRIDLINYILNDAEINTPIRIAHFLAQIAHESGEFRYRIELRSDESADEMYGPGTNVGRVLGNMNEGDGAKFKGRGFMQLTGRHNYQEYSEAVGIDFVDNSSWLELDFWALHSAAWFWNTRDLNAMADRDQVKTITRRINGGFNGMESRLRYLQRAKKVLL